MCHILIIEDEPLISMMIQDLLEDEGAESFDVAVTRDDAVAAALRRLPDLITSDVKLRQGTGPLAVSEIHERLGEIPVIFISGTPEECEPSNPPGIVLSKPRQQGALQEAYHRMI